MVYVDTDTSRKQPILIHRAILGSIERFFGILVENYAGDFPLWLAPVQARLLPVTDHEVSYFLVLFHFSFHQDQIFTIVLSTSSLNLFLLYFFCISCFIFLSFLFFFSSLIFSMNYSAISLLQEWNSLTLKIVPSGGLLQECGC